jgi:RNA polymerase primary sigma factor
MDKSEFIELFYNRTYEKFVNKQILDDKNFIVPRQQLKNYVHELIDIPYIEFIEYLKNKNIKNVVKDTDVTHFSSFSACEVDMCKALIWANNPGCTFVEIGRLFPENVSSRNDIAYRLYGEKHVKAATQLGLTFEYYDYWYLSCIGYIYPDLKEDERKQLLARTITRNNLYQQMLVDIMEHDIYPELYMTMFSGSTLKNRIKCVITFFDICIEECLLNNISTHRLYRRNANIDTPSFLHSTRQKSIYSSFYSYEMLSFEDSLTLFQRYEFRHDLNAFDTLVKSYLRLVISTAKLYVSKGLEYDDLIQEGTLGLIKAIEKFDYIKGFSFGFYAKKWIKQSIINAINTQTLTVNIPQNQLVLYKKVRKEIEKYEQKNEFNPSITEIEIGENIELENLSYLNSLPDDLHELVSRKDNWDDYPSSEFSADDIVMKESRLHFVNSLLKELKHREAEILRSVFGIGVKEETLEEIGVRLYLTRERVRQIKEIAIRKLREIVNPSKGKEQKDYMDEESKEIELTIGETERRERVHKILKRVGNTRRNISDNPQKKQFRLPEKNELSPKEKDRHIDVLPVSGELNELDGVKVGNRIMYNEKECTICKILVRGDSSRFLVKYDNEVFDYVPNNKALYRKVLAQSKSHNGETNVAPNDNNEIEQKKILFSYNSHEFRWNVGDDVTMGYLFTSPITIQGDPYFLFRKNVLFVFMKSRTANKNKVNSKVYLLPTDTQLFKKDFSEKYGKRKPRILLFIRDSPASVHFLDEVKLLRIGPNYIRFESLL